VLEEARGGGGWLELPSELAVVECGVGRIGDSLGAPVGRRLRGKREGTQALKIAWSRGGVTQAVKRIDAGFNGQKRRGGVGGMVTAGRKKLTGQWGRMAARERRRRWGLVVNGAGGKFASEKRYTAGGGDGLLMGLVG
jgi:hypothetical protein